MKYIFPTLVFAFSVAFLFLEGTLFQKNSDIDYFSLSAYGSITIIMMLALFIVQRIIDLREVYYYLLAGFSFVYFSLLLSTLDKLYRLPATAISTLEDLFRLVGFGFVVVAIIKWIKYNDEIKKELVELASIDDLTGIMNRRVFGIEFKREFVNAKRYKKGLALITLDLDRFKEINDRHGHFFGDLVLKVFTKEISSILREGDIFSRWGGDEFSVLLPQTRRRDAMKVAEKIRLAVKNIQVKTDHSPITFTVSLGVTYCKADDRDPMLVTERADRALYEAKTAGRDRSVLL